MGVVLTMRIRLSGLYMNLHVNVIIRLRYWLIFPYVSRLLSQNSQRVLSTYMVECRVSIIGITIMLWVSIPHTGT